MQYDGSGESVAQVYVALPQIRADRRKVGKLTCPLFFTYLHKVASVNPHFSQDIAAAVAMT